MTYPNLANGWTSVLSAGINSTDLSCAVPDTAGIPAFPCQATILAKFPDGTDDTGNADEVVTISANASGTLTIARHTEANHAGSSAGSSHSAGVVISHVLTTQSLADAVASVTGSPNLDGGLASSTYGGLAALDAGGAS